jgi:hypothetical protein
MKSIYITLARTAAIAVAVAFAATTISANAAPARPDRPQSATASTATSLTLIGTVDPQHVDSAKTELVLYGVYAFDPTNVSFNQHVMPASIPQVAVPYVLVPDGNPHTYVLTFHVNTAGTTTTQYQLTDTYGYQSTQTVNDGVNTVSFTVPVHFSGAGWEYVVLKDISGDNWVFYSCDIYEQTG